MFFSSDWLISNYRNQKPLIQRSLIHSLLHCLYKHPFEIYYHTQDYNYDLACDIIVEKIISSMNLTFIQDDLSFERNKVIQTIENLGVDFKIKELIPFLSKCSSEEKVNYIRLFSLDNHQVWPNKNDLKTNQHKETLGLEPNSENTKDSSNIPSDEEGIIATSQHLKTSLINESEIAQQWDEIGKQIDLDLSTFNKDPGIVKGEFVQFLKISTKKKYTFKDSLTQFLTTKEVFQEDLDSFDNIYYLYGLNHLDNRPLIEYLEYKEKKILDELVVVLDTSGSTYYSFLKKFIEMTFAVIKKISDSSHPFKLFIVQVDTEVQNSIEINTLDQLEQFLDDFEVKGGGGTDFRPAFDFVDSLIENKTLSRLKGMIYFTDGYGPFPLNPPIYDTLIVFHEDDYTDENVPVWASKIVVEEEEICEYS